MWKLIETSYELMAMHGADTNILFVAISIISTISILVSFSVSDESKSFGKKNVYKLQTSKAKRSPLLFVQESET